MFSEDEFEKSSVYNQNEVEEVHKYFKNHPEKLVVKHRYHEDFKKIQLLTEKLKREGIIVG